MSVYNRGLDVFADIASADLRWLLLQGSGYTFDKDHATVSALTPGSYEATASGYARVTLTGGVRTVVDGSDNITYGADSPDFGTLTAGETITGLVLFLHVTNDSDSIPVTYYALTPTDSGTFSPFVVTLVGGLVATVAEA